MATASQFRTFQTPQNYEDALARHGQWLRWISGVTCPCLDTNTMQPNPRCAICRGRGRIYKVPGKFRLLDEIARHDKSGRVYPRYVPVVGGSAAVYRKGTLLSLAATQPADLSYIQLNPPYPKEWERITIDYEWNPDLPITNEDSEVVASNLLRTKAPRFSERGKSFEGSVTRVNRVYNVTRDETYTVSAFFKEYIYLVSMGTYAGGDVLETDYVYQKPFNFLLVGVTPRMRYEQPYVLEEADAVLVTPYWAQASPDDLFTALAQEQIGRAVVEPRVSVGNDEITAYYDLSRLLRVIDKNGNEYSTGPGKDVEIFERNELKWNVPKPAIPYVVQFTYHPTYTALPNLHTLRNSENKAFVNRVGVRQFDKVHDRIEY